MTRKMVKNLKQASKFAPFAELWPGLKQTIRAMERGDEEKLYSLVIPAMNGIAGLVERTRDLLREQYRTDLFPFRFHNQRDYPGKQLEQLLTQTLNKLPTTKSSTRRFERLSSMPILASNAILSLHIIRTALAVSKRPQFEDYYRTNLYTQDALLKCALNWFGYEEEITRLTVGNAEADRERRGYLSSLALFNLITLEKNPTIKSRYIDIFDVHWKNYRNEDNPLAMAFQQICSNQKKGSVGLILRALDLYPEDRLGFGDDYWRAHGVEIGETVGGGVDERFSREPLPISLRPKDSFLWQRNSRRLRGDHVKLYPATDYLFVYWFCRYYGIIPPTPQHPTVKP
jgi:hypothetical protein